MATLNELAKAYAERINSANIDERVEEFRKIQSEIDDLVYTSSRERLSDADKVEIYEKIKSELKTRTVGFSAPGKAMFECANDELMILIDTVINRHKR